MEHFQKKKELKKHSKKGKVERNLKRFYGKRRTLVYERVGVLFSLLEESGGKKQKQYFI